jgi:acetyl-CoA acetyltransferase
VPKPLKAASPSVDDIGLQDLNWAFAVHVLQCRNVLVIPAERLSNDGAIAGEHPIGLNGQQLTAHALLARKRPGIHDFGVTVYIGSGTSAASVFEVV